MELHGTANGDQVVEIARTWLGTRYHHQAHTKGVGCDCIGLVIGIWEELFKGRIPKDWVLPPYTPHWGDETGQFTVMADYARRYLVPITSPVQDADPKPQAGDISMWRMLRHGPTKHAGIITSPTTMIHAYYGHNVMESSLVSNQGSALTHLFRFPADWVD